MCHKWGANEAMKYVQQVRGKCIVPVIVPEELRGIVGQRELVHVGLTTELARAGVPRGLSKMISGHALQEVASVYIHATPVTLMADALNKVNFNLPIPHLRSKQ
jgi:hypothetical protein